MLSQPTWGYPKVHVADPEEQQQEAARQRRVRWWHWAAAIFNPLASITIPLLAAKQAGHIDSSASWGIANGAAAAWWVGAGVAAGAATGGLLAMPIGASLGMSFGTLFAGGLIAGGMVGGFSLLETGRRTNGFQNLTGQDVKNLTARSFFGAAAGAAAKAISPVSLLAGGDFAQMFISNGAAFGFAYLAERIALGNMPTLGGFLRATFGGVAPKPISFAVNLTKELVYILEMLLKG